MISASSTGPAITDKPGKKLWIWGLSREGEIWKDLLTDSALGNTQYVELQSGLHFNQAVMQSSRTPFKHMAFLPQTSVRFTESWFPFRDLDGVTRATPDGVLDVRQSDGTLLFGFCPTGSFKGTIAVVAGGKTLLDRAVSLQPLQTFRDSIVHTGPGNAFEVRVGDLLRYSSADEQSQALERPIREQRSLQLGLSKRACGGCTGAGPSTGCRRGACIRIVLH